MKTKNRREFLLGAGITLSSVAASSHLFGEACTIPANSILTNEGSPSGTEKPAPVRKAMRGLMVDAGRVPESMDYYRRVIEFCADWELNTLHFRLADDQGSALRFTSVPDLLTHKNAFTPEQLKSLADYAKSHGVDLIPELESFGHTGYITRSPAYAHLLDDSAQGRSEFTGIIPVSPETLHLFDTLYREVASIFPSIYFHGGCDEVNWGGSPLSRKALETRTRVQIWAEYLGSLNRISEGLGKQLIVWGDFVLHKEPEILGRLDKSIIIMDWNYSEVSSAKIQDAFLKIRANGSRAIGAPALIRYKWGPRAGSEQLRNIDAFSDCYLGSNDPGSLGVVLTNWVPSRYVQNSIWDGFAYAAVAFNQGAAAAQTSGLRRFVERHYQANWSETWEEAFQLIYDDAPYIEDGESSSWMGLRLPIPWSDDEQLAALLRDRSPRQNPFTQLRSLLVLLEPSVLKNLADFQAFELCVEYLERMFWREMVVIEHAARRPIEREITDQLIQNIAERDQALAEALSRDWDKGRPADSLAKSEPLFGLAPKDQLLFQWRRATAYSASLASHPDHFHQLIAG
jgi:Glycosyl hydrolase family 20, catalytic domain